MTELERAINRLLQLGKIRQLPDGRYVYVDQEKPAKKKPANAKPSAN
jgi:hypothetical protein